jgi:hypothetical protein
MAMISFYGVTALPGGGLYETKRARSLYRAGLLMRKRQLEGDVNTGL